MNIVQPILNLCRRQPAAVALVEAEREISYAELGRLVLGTARQLRAQGLPPGARVGLCLRDDAAHIIALLAAACAGCAAVTLDWRAKPAESGRFARELALTCVLTEPGLRPPDGAPAWVIDAAWQQAVRDGGFADAAAHAGDGHEAFMISATSGSTGAPKFTQMTHLQYHAAVTGMLELMALSGRHRFLCTSPLYYSGGRNSCLAHLLRGDAIVLYPSLFSAGEYLEVVRRRRISVAVLVPSMVRQLLALPGEDVLLPDMAALFCSGAPLHPEEKRAAARRLSPRFQERYGTSETLAIAALRPERFADRLGSVGQPHSLIEAGIADEDGRPLPPGATGRLRLRGPGIGTPLLSSAAQFAGGWFYPGEIASLDAEDFIFLHGRGTDVMMRHGAKIFPAEVEAVLASHAAVQEAAVLGHRDAGEEDMILAFVVTRHPVPAGEILAHCRRQLTPHKVPRHIMLVEALPRNTAGKIDRQALAALFEAPQG